MLLSSIDSRLPISLVVRACFHAVFNPGRPPRRKHQALASFPPATKEMAGDSPQPSREKHVLAERKRSVGRNTRVRTTQGTTETAEKIRGRCVCGRPLALTSGALALGRPENAPGLETADAARAEPRCAAPHSENGAALKIAAGPASCTVAKETPTPKTNICKKRL